MLSEQREALEGILAMLSEYRQMLCASLAGGRGHAETLEGILAMLSE